MPNNLTRVQAQRKVDELYQKISFSYRLLKPMENILDEERAYILNKLERILYTVRDNKEYKEGISRLDNDGYRAYVDMLQDLVDRIDRGNSNSSPLQDLPTHRYLNMRYPQPVVPAFVPGPARREPEPPRDIPESAWNKYYKRDLRDGQYFGSIPFKRTIELGRNYLMVIGDFLPAPYDAIRDDKPSTTGMRKIKEDLPSHVNQSIHQTISSTVRVSSFLSRGLGKITEKDDEGHRIGDIFLDYQKEKNANDPVNAWVVKIVIRNLLVKGKLASTTFDKDEARIYLDKLKQNEKDVYEKIVALFI